METTKELLVLDQTLAKCRLLSVEAETYKYKNEVQRFFNIFIVEIFNSDLQMREYK